MGGFSVWHWLIVGIVILLLFGKGRFSDMMGDIAKGLKSFKKGMTDDDDAPSRPAEPPRQIRDSKTLEVPADRGPIEAPAADRSRDLDASDRREP
jgi:sec-independent protein translocase protein TatA